MKLELILKVDDCGEQKLIVDVVEERKFYESIPGKAYDIKSEKICEGKKLVIYKYDVCHILRNRQRNNNSVCNEYRYGTMRFNPIESFQEPKRKLGTIWLIKKLIKIKEM